MSGGTLSQVNARTFANNIDVTANTSSVIKTNSYDMTLTGNWSGAGTVTRTGNTKLKLTGDLSAFTGTLITTEGDLYLSNKSFGTGTLSMRGNSTLSSAVNVPTGATLDLARTSNTTINNTYTFEAGSTLSVGSNTTVNTDVSLAGTSIRVATGTSLVKSDGSDWNHTVVSGQTYTKGSSVFSNTDSNMTVSGTDLGGNTTLNLSGGTLTLGTSDQIPVTTGIKAQFDSASTGSIQTNANGTVATWFDSSGNNNNATLKQGTITKTSLNGNTTLDFDNGGTTYLSFNRISDIKTVLWVAKDDTPSDKAFILGDDSYYNFHRGGSGQIWDAQHAYPAKYGKTIIDGKTASATTVLNKQWQLIAATSSQNMNANAISMDRAGSCGARSWTGEMGEILIFNQVLTDAQITELGIYLQNKWGLSTTYKGIFYSPTTALNVTDDTAVDIGDYTTVTFGTATVANGKKLSIDIPENQTTTWTSAFAGQGAVLKSGDGTLVLSGSSSNTGGIIITDGILKANSKASLGSGLVYIEENGTLQISTDGSQTFNTITGYNSTSGVVELTFGTGGYDTQVPVSNFSGTIKLLKSGSYTYNKLNTNGCSFEGTTIDVSSGTSIYVTNTEFKGNILLNGTGNSENRGAIRASNTISGDITLMSNANIGVDGTQTLSGDITSGVASGETILTLGAPNSGGSGIFSGTISDGTAGSTLSVLVYNGSHTFSGDVSYTGSTTINSGKTLYLSGNANLGSSSAVNLFGNLNFSSYTGTDAMRLNNLNSAGTGVITGIDKDLEFYNDTTTLYQGKIDVGTGTITKTGDGNLRLYATNSGDMKAGNFLIQSGRVDLKEHFTGEIKVLAGASLSPGNSIGKLTVTGGTTLGEKGSLIMEVAGQSASLNDQLFLTGDLTLEDDSVIQLVMADGVSFAPNEPIKVIVDADNSESLTDLIGHVWSYYFTGLSYEKDGDTWMITGHVDPNAVPEPSTWVLLILGTVGLMWYRRRK